MKSLKDQMITKGMGSGIPLNQKMAGASNPVEAAHLASRGIDPEKAEKEAELQESMSRKMSLIEQGIEAGFSPSTAVSLDSGIDKINEVYKELEDWEAKNIEEEAALEFGPEYDIPMDDPLYNPIRDTKRRREIEETLKPLDFESMIFNGYATQSIQIRKNFEVTFRTLNTNQSLWLESMTLDLQEQSVQYGRHYMSLVQLAVSLEKINNKDILPNISKFNKNSQEAEFRKALTSRMEYIGQLPQVITDDLIIQYAWFSARVRKLMAGDIIEKVGNS